MSLQSLLPWIVFLHVLAAFAFVAGHGVSVLVAFRLRQERDPARLAAMLDLSAASLGMATIGALVLLIAGIVAGIVAGSFGRAWIWLSLVVLIAVAVAMTPLGGSHFARIRRALGQRTRDIKATDPTPVAASPEELDALLDSWHPEALALIGGGGFVLLLWLMLFRPF